jgi:hypothetical protein
VAATQPVTDPLAEASRVMPNITGRCVRLVRGGADPHVLAGELARVLGEITGRTWTAERITELAGQMAPTP